MNNRLLTIFLLVLFAGTLVADFKLKDIDVVVFARDEPLVEETISFYITTNESLNEHKTAPIARNDLEAWVKRTSLNDIRQHFDPEVANISEFIILPQETKYSAAEGSYYSSVRIQYIAHRYYNGTVALPDTGIFTVAQSKPRIKEYVLNEEALNFGSGFGGDAVLGENVRLTLQLPKEAQGIYFSIDPSEAEPSDFTLGSDGKKQYIGDERTFYWMHTRLPSFTVKYYIELPLQEEIRQAVDSIANRVVLIFTGRDSLSAIVLVAAILVSTYAILKVKK